MTEPSALRVEDFMHSVVHVVRETDTIRDAHALMRVARIRHLPVVDEEGTLAGVVSDRDLNLGLARGIRGRISEVMTRYLHWVHPESSARDAAARMLEHKIGCLPVVDKDMRLVGIVTETDFLAIAQRALAFADAARDLERPLPPPGYGE